MAKKEVINESAAVLCADIRISLAEEIDRTRSMINEDSQPDEEGLLRAKLSGLEWALSDVLRLVTLHQVGS